MRMKGTAKDEGSEVCSSNAISVVRVKEWSVATLPSNHIASTRHNEPERMWQESGVEHQAECVHSHGGDRTLFKSVRLL